MDASPTVVLLCDDFSSYPAAERLDDRYFRDTRQEGSFGRQSLGPWRQSSLHYCWHSDRIQSWSECSLPWRLVDRDGRRWLEQPESFPNVVLTAGADDWADYVMELDVAVNDGPGGPIVRYHTGRQNYWAAFQAGQPVRLIRRNQDEHVTIATSGPLTVAAGRVYRCRITCQGDLLELSLDGNVCLAARDDTYARGAVGLRTDGPCRFSGVRVLTWPVHRQAMEFRRAARTGRKAPAPRLLHELALPPSATVVHVRDINDDGRMEVLACQVAVPQQDYIQLAQITAMDLAGGTLWTYGQPMPERFMVHGAFAFNVADIDGDGRTEIIATRDLQIVMLDGATGQLKRSAPTPLSYLGREDAFERTVGDSILVCNLRGLGGPRDILLKDRYLNVWAYTGDLRPLWHRHLNTGHYCRAGDINGDGRDEVLAGYSMLASDGRTLWTVPGGDADVNRYPGPEHADSVLVDRFGLEADAPVQVALAASDLGFLLLDVEGRLLAQTRVGHAQSLAAARFRPDLPGRQFAVLTAWGNFDIVNMFDCQGNLLQTIEAPNSSIVPIHWCGDGGALLCVGGHLADGNLQPLCELPRGEFVSPCAWDVNGDGLDEIILREGNMLRIYGPAERPARVIAPPRASLINWNDYGGFLR